MNTRLYTPQQVFANSVLVAMWSWSLPVMVLGLGLHRGLSLQAGLFCGLFVGWCVTVGMDYHFRRVLRKHLLPLLALPSGVLVVVEFWGGLPGLLWLCLPYAGYVTLRH